MKKNISLGGLNKIYSGKKDDSDYTYNGSQVVEKQPESYKLTNFEEEIKSKENFEGMDLCFILDVTGSMSSYIEGTKQTIKNIMNDAKLSLEKLEKSEDLLRFAIVAYRDHPPQENTFVTKICDFTTSEKALAFLNELTADGGGDAPEAVLDGLYDGLYNVAWNKNTEKFIFLIADAPPHGKRFTKGGDGFPDGCPCGYSEVNMLPKLKDMKIDFTIIKLNSSIDEMIKLFSQYCNIDVHCPGSNVNNMVDGCKSKVMENMKGYIKQVKI
jgi:hypothetical protein